MALFLVTTLHGQNNLMGNIIPRPAAAYTTIVVVSAAGDEPMYGATIKIICRGDTLTAATQKFSIGQMDLALYFYERVPKDSVELRVSYLGYKPFVRKYSATEFRGGKRVQLLDDETMINQIVVIGEQIAMVIKGDTMIYNASSFKTLEGDRFSALLKQLPGIEVKQNKIYASGEEIKRVYIDGRNLFGDSPGYSLSDLSADNVRSVKVYDQQSDEAKYLGSTTAKPDKVMNVSTHTKPKVIKGAMGIAGAGMSIDRNADFPDEDLRYFGMAELYRNAESGNQRVSLNLLRNYSMPQMNDVKREGISPSSSQKISLGHSVRKGDSRGYGFDLSFDRNRTKNISETLSEYFPTEQYALRTQNSIAQSRQDSYNISAGSRFDHKRKGAVIIGSIKASLNNSSGTGFNMEQQQIDQQVTMLNRNMKSKQRGGSAEARMMSLSSLSKKTILRINAEANYSHSSQNAWDVDTVASERGMRVFLDNNTASDNVIAKAQIALTIKASKNIAIDIGDDFDYRYRQSRRTSIDYIDNPTGDFDSVNSYDYTINALKNSITSKFTLTHKKWRFVVGIDGQLYRPVSRERLPDLGRTPHNYYAALPSLDISYRTIKHNFSLSATTDTEDLSVEELRSSLNATNPLSLRAGNPTLRQTKGYTATLRYMYTDAEHSATYSINASASLKTDFLTTQSTLFTEAQYLPQYDYTAQKGAQLIKPVNADGYYGWSADASYSKRLEIRWTVTAAAKYNFTRMPYFIGIEPIYSRRNTAGITLGATSTFSSKVVIGINSDSELTYYSTQNTFTRQFTQSIGGSIRTIIRKNNTLAASTSYYMSRNYSSPALDQNNLLTNISAGRKFGKERNIELTAGVIDLFNRINSIRTAMLTDQIMTTSNAYLGRYGYLQVSFRF